MKALIVLPLRVSPLIKLTRWIFLISGIYYGIVKHKEYTIAAADFRAEQERLKSLRAAKFAREEAIRNQETAKNLAEALTGLRVQFEKALGSEDTTLTEESTSIDNNDNSTSNDASKPINDSISNEDVKQNQDLKSD